MKLFLMDHLLMDREGSVKHKCKTFFEENFSFSLCEKEFSSTNTYDKINQMIMKFV